MTPEEKRELRRERIKLGVRPLVRLIESVELKIRKATHERNAAERAEAIASNQRNRAEKDALRMKNNTVRLLQKAAGLRGLPAKELQAVMSRAMGHASRGDWAEAERAITTPYREGECPKCGINLYSLEGKPDPSTLPCPIGGCAFTHPRDRSPEWNRERPTSLTIGDSDIILKGVTR